MVSRKVLKRKTINSPLNIGVMYHGFHSTKISIQLSDEDDQSIDIGWHETDDEDDELEIQGSPAEVNLAIDDAIDNLKLMIARLEKLKKMKNNDKADTADKVNELRTFNTGLSDKKSKK